VHASFLLSPLRRRGSSHREGPLSLDGPLIEQDAEKVRQVSGRLRIRSRLSREGNAQVPFLLAEQRRGWSLMIFCARATRGRGLPSLDARSGRSISPHPQRENKRAWKEHHIVQCAQERAASAIPFTRSSGEKQDLIRKRFHKSSGLRPVTLDRRASMRGPISSRS
jgi:hypothetical protein